MNSALKHRGPDNLNHIHDGKICLGHARLSIIDLSASANQPFLSTCGNYIIVFNGEIYNYHEVKAQIIKLAPEIKLRTSSDTEVLLNAFILLGEKCLELLNGMFAFAIWNKKDESLFIARDRAGEKPLYYYQHENKFVFSSEIRSLLACNEIPRKLNEAVLNDYLNYQTVHAPNTLIEEVKMLLPGQYLKLKQNKLDLFTYWNISEYLQPIESSSHTEKIKSLFENSIRLRMIADVEVGAFLSGGIDSSAVVAQMSQLSKKSISTFSIIFGEKDFSEEEYSNQIAKLYNTNHHPIRIHANDFLNDVPNILKSVDFPGGDGPNSYVVAKATKQTGIKVALSGLGGDELFAGYPIFKQVYNFHSKKLLKNTPAFIRKTGGLVARTLKKGTTSDKLSRILAEKKLTDANFYANSRKLFSEKDADSILNHNRSPLPVYEIASKIFDVSQTNLLSKVSAAEICTYMQNVLLRDTDQMTMAHALEVRTPFLDHELMQYVLSVPDDIKYPNSPKKLFVLAMGDLLPPEIVNRKKMGFTFPWAHWMRNELKDFCKIRIENLGRRKYFNAEALKILWNKFDQNDPSTPWSRIWHLVTLEEWLSNNNIE